jgi:glycosyltransferase involved in cell wall biosynthesis
LKTVAIVLTYNNSETIEACIASVVGQVKHVIVVDNASEDDTVEKAGAFSNVTIM